MKQRINLYSNQYVPKYTLLSLNTLVFSLFSTLVLFAVVSALLAWRGSEMRNQVDDLKAYTNDLQVAVDEAQQTLKNRQPDPQLLAAIEGQKLELNQRERLLQELSNRERIKNNRFSQVLADLSQADTDAVWLTTIHLSDEQIQLHGYGTQADAMPNWLSNLSTTSSFMGTDFQQATMRREDAGLFFSLKTDLATLDTRGAVQ